MSSPPAAAAVAAVAGDEDGDKDHARKTRPKLSIDTSLVPRASLEGDGLADLGVSQRLSEQERKRDPLFHEIARLTADLEKLEDLVRRGAEKEKLLQDGDPATLRKHTAIMQKVKQRAEALQEMIRAKTAALDRRHSARQGMERALANDGESERDRLIRMGHITPFEGIGERAKEKPGRLASVKKPLPLPAAQRALPALARPAQAKPPVAQRPAHRVGGGKEGRGRGRQGGDGGARKATAKEPSPRAAEGSNGDAAEFAQDPRENEMVQTLMEMGFEEHAARAALRRTRFDMDAACARLLNPRGWGSLAPRQSDARRHDGNRRRIVLKDEDDDDRDGDEEDDEDDGERSGGRDEEEWEEGELGDDSDGDEGIQSEDDEEGGAPQGPRKERRAKRFPRLHSGESLASEGEDEGDGDGEGEDEGDGEGEGGCVCFLDLNRQDEGMEFDGGLVVPVSLWENLLDYQQTGVKWLWELHSQEIGGLVGDEMGLGKTIQVVVFLGALHHSGLLKGPVFVACPATVMRHWKREFARWYPLLPTTILHTSECAFEHLERTIAACVEATGVVITTYESLRVYQDLILPHDWQYVVLDEGHKIRNPDAAVTLVCKCFRTPHRLLLSGAPVQNSLRELWSVFDFVYPGKLGTLPVFEEQLALPIRMGGFANASSAQVQTAYRCALALKDMIGPFMLRRRKCDVNHMLPRKSEHVLMCSLTPEQHDLYVHFLRSSEVRTVRENRGGDMTFHVINRLRQICNHPDLGRDGEAAQSGGPVGAGVGDPAVSGKLRVLDRLLAVWRPQGHRVLVFTQQRRMLDFVQQMCAQHGYEHRRMDGSTAVRSRDALVEEFNNDAGIFVFLLTTRTGGVGVNLVGADRVVVVDPDWNPSTDDQAKERAWRVGQRREVRVYRLVTQGTIEEKMYHRQIYKQFLVNKVLHDPKQRRFFKSNELEELFSPPPPPQMLERSETERMVEGEDEEAAVVAVRRPTHRSPNRVGGGGDGGGGGGGGGGSSGGSDGGSSGGSGGEGNEGAPRKRRRREGSRVVAAAARAPKRRREQGRDSSGSSNSGNNDGGGERRSPAKANSNAGVDEEDRDILESLFESAGIQSAIEHDQLCNASNPDHEIVSATAAQVARNALDALRRSRQGLQNHSIARPTWTGRSGVAGRPGMDGAPRFGRPVGAVSSGGDASGGGGGGAVASASLLASLRNRGGAGGRAVVTDADGEAKGAGGTMAQVVEGLRKLFEDNGGKLKTSQIAEYGNAHIHLDEQSQLAFKTVLRSIADFVRARRVWLLKREFA